MAPRLTHFLCIPLVSAASRAQLERSIGDFRHAVLEPNLVNGEAGRIPTEAIRPILAKLVAPPLQLSLRSLVPMQTAESTAVLYARPVDESRRLYDFGVAVQRLFLDAGLLIDDQRPLTLHATIVNTTYARARAAGAVRGGRCSMPALGSRGTATTSGRRPGPSSGWPSAPWARRTSGLTATRPTRTSVLYTLGSHRREGCHYLDRPLVC